MAGRRRGSSCAHDYGDWGEWQTTESGSRYRVRYCKKCGNPDTQFG